MIPATSFLKLINPIFKENYKGICISSAFLKVICILLNNRVQEHCKTHNIISKNQIGFMKNRRTTHHLLTLKTVVNKYVTNGKTK